MFIDVQNGNIHLLGEIINKDTTLDEFQNKYGQQFECKCLTKPENTVHVHRCSLNEKVGLGPTKWYPFIYGKHTLIELNGMEFVNVIVNFANQKIREIKFITEMSSGVYDENGELKYSDKAERERFVRMNEWSIKQFDEPTEQDKYGVRWFYDWGTIEPSSAVDDGYSTLYVEFK